MQCTVTDACLFKTKAIFLEVDPNMWLCVSSKGRFRGISSVCGLHRPLVLTHGRFEKERLSLAGAYLLNRNREMAEFGC